jgi:hypothetical protein
MIGLYLSDLCFSTPVNVIVLLVTASVVPRPLIIFTLMMEAIRFSDTSVLKRVTRPYIPEDGILHSHLRENHKS